MKQLLEFIPLILFFAVYKLVGVREASIVLVIATLAQLLILKWKYGQVEKQPLIMGSAVIFFGVLTAYFNELEYLKWKVTIVYGLFAAVLLLSQWLFNKNLIQLMLAKNAGLQLPDKIWRRLNGGWALFFVLCMLLNLYVSYFFSDDVWVNFKTFGIIGMTLAATLITGLYLYRYLPKEDKA